MKIQQNIQALNETRPTQELNGAMQRGRVGTEERKVKAKAQNHGGKAFPVEALWTDKVALKGGASSLRGIVMHQDSFDHAAIAVQSVSTPYAGLTDEAAKEAAQSAIGNILSNINSAMFAHSGISPERVLELID